MRPLAMLIRPATLAVQSNYLQRTVCGDGRRTRQTAVKFIKYDPCAAFAIVQDESGKTWRCPRDDLYTVAPFDGNSPHLPTLDGC